MSFRKYLRFSLRTVAEAIFVLATILTLFLVYRQPEIRPGDHLQIRVVGTLLGNDIDGLFLVAQDGTVSLGPAYGSVVVEDMQVAEAEQAISANLRRILSSPKVSVVLVGDDALLMLQEENRQLKKQLKQLTARNRN